MMDETATLHRHICQQGKALLATEKKYTQVDVHRKMAHLGFPHNHVTFHNILSGKAVGPKTLQRAAEYLQAVVEKELGLAWAAGGFSGPPPVGFQSEVVPTGREDGAMAGFGIYETGRVPMAQKVRFFQSARQSVHEVGTRLNKFTNNLCSGSHAEFRGPLEALLTTGVNYRCYLLNPEHSSARTYFNDRQAVQALEANYVQIIRDNIERLRDVEAEFASQGFPGRFEVYTYSHVPNNYFLIVDGGEPHCRMMVSHYLYGLERKKAPVFEFSRQAKPGLYRCYWESFQVLAKGAKLVVPST